MSARKNKKMLENEIKRFFSAAFFVCAKKHRNEHPHVLLLELNFIQKNVVVVDRRTGKKHHHGSNIK
jgi:hypothetical protein